MNRKQQHSELNLSVFGFGQNLSVLNLIEESVSLPISRTTT